MHKLGNKDAYFSRQNIMMRYYSIGKVKPNEVDC